MGKHLITPILTILLLILAVTVAADTPGQGAARGGAKFAASKGQADKDDAAFGELSDSQKSKGFEKARANKLFDRFQQSTVVGSGGQNYRKVDGRFTGFELWGDEIRAFHVFNGTGNTTLFTSIKVPGMPAGTPKVTGAVWRLRGDNVSLSVHNNPVGLLSLRASKNYTQGVTFTLPGGTSFPANQNVTNDGLRVNRGTTLHWHLMPTGNTTLAYNGSNVTATFAGEGGVVVQFHPTTADNVYTGAVHEVNKAVAKGKAGAVLGIVNADGKPLQAGEAMGAQATVKTLLADGVTVTASSDDPAGKIIILNLDPGVVKNVTDPARIKVSIDGSQVALDPLATVDMFLNATSAKAKVWSTTNGLQVWVYVPGFSDHDISVQSTGTTGGNGGNNNQTSNPPPEKTPGFGVAALLAGAAIGVLLLRRR